MAELSFSERWMLVVPDVLGNRDCEKPFRVKVRRLTEGELQAWMERSWEARARLVDGLTVEEALEIFEPFLQGPIGSLTINGAPVEDLRGLLEWAIQDPPLEGCMWDGLREAVVLANTIAEVQAKNCARRRGTSGGRTATAAAPHPSDAPDAESSSGTAST